MSPKRPLSRVAEGSGAESEHTSGGRERLGGTGLLGGTTRVGLGGKGVAPALGRAAYRCSVSFYQSGQCPVNERRKADSESHVAKPDFGFKSQII